VDGDPVAQEGLSHDACSFCNSARPLSLLSRKMRGGNCISVRGCLGPSGTGNRCTTTGVPEEYGLRREEPV